MKEKLKSVVYGGCLLAGALLAMGAEGGMVAEALTESQGIGLMVMGVGLFALPLLIEKLWGEQKEG